MYDYLSLTKLDYLSLGLKSLDDVVEAVDFASFPNPGETGKEYRDATTGKSYYWDGSAYVESKGVDATARAAASIAAAAAATAQDDANTAMEIAEAAGDAAVLAQGAAENAALLAQEAKDLAKDGTVVGEAQDYNVIRAAMWFDTSSPIFRAALHYDYDPVFGNLPEVQVNYSYYDCPITEKDGMTSRLPDGFLWCGGYINSTRFPMPGKNCRYYNQNSMNGGGPNFGTMEQTDAVLQAFVDLPVMPLPVMIDLTGYARYSEAGMALKATLVERGYTITLNEPMYFKPCSDISAVATVDRDDAVDITFGFNWEAESWLYMQVQFSRDGGETWGDDQWPWAYPWNGNPVMLSAVGALLGGTSYKLRMKYTTDWTNWSGWFAMSGIVTTNPVVPLDVPVITAVSLVGRKTAHLEWTETNWTHDQRMFDIQYSLNGTDWSEVASSIWHWYWDAMSYNWNCPNYETNYYFRMRCRTNTKTSAWSPSQMITTGVAPSWHNTPGYPAPPAIAGAVLFMNDPGLMDVQGGEVVEMVDYTKTYSMRKSSISAQPQVNQNGEIIFNQASMRYLRCPEFPVVANCTMIMIGCQLAIPNLGDGYGPFMGAGEAEPGQGRVMGVSPSPTARAFADSIQTGGAWVNAGYNLTTKALYMARFGNGISRIEHNGLTGTGTVGGFYNYQMGLLLGSSPRNEPYSFAKICGNFAMTAALYIPSEIDDNTVNTVLKPWIQANAAAFWPSIVLA